MKICVFGLGAIGGHLACRLSNAGAEVSAIARGAQLAAVRANGLRLHSPTEDFTARIAATDDPAALGPQDLVIVAVKAPALPGLAASIGHLLGPETPVVFAMNGIPWWYYHRHGGPRDGTDIPLLDPGAALRHAIGIERAIGGVVYSACTVEAPGLIHVEHSHNRLVIGEPDGTLSPRATTLAGLLTRGGLPTEATQTIRDVLWSKLLLNLGSGLLGVLSGAAPRGFFTETACRDATRAIVHEAAAIAAALGRTVTPDAEGQIRNGSKSSHKTSILQDLELGRPMEIDALYTVPLQMARQANIPTPTLDLLSALVRIRAQQAGLYSPPFS